ncbi:MAG TPA: TonB-dependent receptor [Gemmatimonadales bacterium]|nr:TonB-dependent receptor [Gemmatimonadales bacterium]
MRAACQTICILAGLAARAGDAPAQEPVPPGDFSALDIDELARVRITTVSRRPEPVSRAAAAVTVISREDLRRSGASTLPDMLRTVPGLHVARVGSRDWAVGARGFNSQLSNKVLVIVDGRTVYSPIFGGVFWDALAIPLDEVDRIEVIRGPGATLWGANAVNGVINIITRAAAESDGGRISVSAGTRVPVRGSVRYGNTFGEGAAYRVYAGGRDRDPAMLEDGTDAADDWRFGQAGFRLDGAPGAERWTIQGDIYNGTGDTELLLPVGSPPYVTRQRDQLDVRGGNLLGRWTHGYGEAAEIGLQVTYDYGFRRQAELFGTLHSNVLDFDLQHRLPGPGSSDLIWGVGYRLKADEVSGAAPISFQPTRRSTHLASGFVQAELPVGARMAITAGSKIDHNSFTGVEVQPNVRLLWVPGPRHSLWGSVSRAVRTPTRLESDALAVVAAPGDPIERRLVGSDDVESEALIAYEAGYRTEPGRGVSLDLALFYNDYDHLRTIEPGTPDASGPRVVVPLSYANHARGRSWGAELNALFRPAPGWRLRLSYAHLQLRLELTDEAAAGAATDAVAGNDPEHMAGIHSSMDLPGNFELDVVGRYVGALEGAGTADYATARIRLGWRWQRRVELSVTGQDLFASRHREFPTGVYVADDRYVERRAYVQAVWRF